MRRYVLPGINLIEKLTWRLGGAEEDQSLWRYSWIRCHQKGPKVDGEPVEWCVAPGGIGKPYYADANEMRYHAHQMLEFADRWEQQQKQDRLTALRELCDSAELMTNVVFLSTRRRRQ
jgi:hypothetical protein